MIFPKASKKKVGFEEGLEGRMRAGLAAGFWKAEEAGQQMQRNIWQEQGSSYFWRGVELDEQRSQEGMLQDMSGEIRRQVRGGFQDKDVWTCGVPDVAGMHLPRSL